VRFKTAVALLLIVVISTTTFPVTGQEEPLPAIQPKGSLAPLTPSVVLPAEPVAVPVPLPTLEEAARANDYITFDALYRDAVKRGDSMAAFAPLHEIWTYGITDPIGAFYGPGIYDRLVRAYPGFASYIAEYRIVDSNGNVFYPTSETRTFLLDRALEGRAPGVQLVEGQRSSSTPRVELRSTTTGSVWDRVPATSQRSTASPRRSTAASKRSSTSPKRSITASSGTPASSPADTAASRRRTSRPKARKHVAAVATKKEPKAAARDAAGPAGGDASVPKASAPVAEKAPVVAEKTPVVTDTAAAPTTTAEAPVVVRAEPTTTEPATVTPATVTPATTDTSVPAPQPIAVDNSFGGRGVLLLVIGLIGVGLLAMMLRAPREVPPSIMQSPDAVPPPGDKPTGPTPVEPLRRPSAAPEPPPPGKNRAGGSHG